ncbi:MAG: hypothetical protein HDT14_11865 [Oscillibacter sp.]|nr:hypothetical protein [Oscillibacter sp.]
MYVLVRGNVAAVKTFPSVTIRQLNYNTSQPKLYEVFCSGRQQLISAGRTQALQYTYLWKEQLNQVGLPPEVLVTDLSGVEVDSGEADTLPPNKTLRFKSTFDGELIISNNNRVVDKQKISADKYIELDGLSYGLSIQVVIGLDIIWKLSFKKQRPIVAKDEIDILKRITNVSGIMIPAPHSLQNMLTSMSRYPQICQWIRKCIKNGIINEQSYRRLQMAYRSMNTNR